MNMSAVARASAGNAAAHDFLLSKIDATISDHFIKYQGNEHFAALKTSDRNRRVV